MSTAEIYFSEKNWKIPWLKFEFKYNFQVKSYFVRKEYNESFFP